VGGFAVDSFSAEALQTTQIDVALISIEPCGGIFAVNTGSCCNRRLNGIEPRHEKSMNRRQATVNFAVAPAGITCSSRGLRGEHSCMTVAAAFRQVLCKLSQHRVQNHVRNGAGTIQSMQFLSV